MKVICDGLDLSSAILTVSKAIGSKMVNPIFEGIKLKAVGDNLILTATDTEITIEKTIRADVLMEGETVVAGKIFGDFIKKLEKEQIEISKLDSTSLKIRYSGSESELQVFSADEYPVINKNISDNFIELKSGEFKDVVDKTVFACATDDSRPILKGCLFEVEDDSLTAVSLDGVRMSVIKKDVLASSGKFKAIIPARTLLEITRLIGNDDDILRISVTKNSLMISLFDTVLISRLIEGEFIKYKQILPTEFTTNLSSIERASLVSRQDKTNVVKFDIKEDFIGVSSKSELGAVNENIAINMDGKDLVIAFNGKYLLDYLKACNDDFINIKLNSSIDPCIIQPMVKEDYTYLIVPVRISNI